LADVDGLRGSDLRTLLEANASMACQFVAGPGERDFGQGHVSTRRTGQPSAEIADKTFARLNNAHVTLKLTTPDGQTETLPMDWSGTQDGAYQTQVSAATKEGTYQLQVDATQGTENLGT